ncbi:HlyD family type I secretion periplasmic adaptor subunit [Duganella sp. HH101]|uniref:HlyD family type I secretion periplasmic adaptor subunit n=1 Tax=Duganella sp. HH101 TaxID=1781066 RepID=UPI000893F746|nr:HlyD family type I secretion periplasmic adaptor subunit [Duganella sp. HH101]OFA00214.1 hemolysin secretion protein D, plasmid [Duganella sp. HH101]
MTSTSHTSQPAAPTLRPPTRWHDPLRLIHEDAPTQTARTVLWIVCLLTLVMLVWAAFGQLDIIVSAEGRLVPQTLLKIVQPAEAGVVTELLVQEGDRVRAGQILARLDTTLAHADRSGIDSDLRSQRLQVRRIEAELRDQPLFIRTDEDRVQYEQLARQYTAHRSTFLDALAQENFLLEKLEHELLGATEVLAKLEQTLPSFLAIAENFKSLAKDGYVPEMRSIEKGREATEKVKDLHAQQATVGALGASIAAQRKKISQLRSSYHSELEKELAEVRARIAQLQPNLDKSTYRERLTELRAPQAGIIKDLATTTVGAVVQPGSVVLTLVPKDELLYADVGIRNEDIGFVRVGQNAQIKLATYPFQKYGMLTGKLIFVSEDALDPVRRSTAAAGAEGEPSSVNSANYKVRIQLEQQILRDADGNQLHLASGMQVQAEINQGRRTVLQYLLSPISKVINESARER